MSWSTSPQNTAPPALASTTPFQPTPAQDQRVNDDFAAQGLGGITGGANGNPISGQTRPLEVQAQWDPIQRPAALPMSKPLETVPGGQMLPSPVPSGNGSIVQPPRQNMDQSPAGRVSSALLRRYQRPTGY
jgi:hypothetical protein